MTKTVFDEAGSQQQFWRAFVFVSRAWGGSGQLRDRLSIATGSGCFCPPKCGDRSGAVSVPYSMGGLYLTQRVKWPGRRADHFHLDRVEV